MGPARDTPSGSTSLTPFLAIEGAGLAVEFYRSVLGARVVDVTQIGGVVVHAELDLGNGKLQLGEPSPDYGFVPAPPGESDCYSLGLFCDDVDVVVARAGSRSGSRRRGRDGRQRGRVPHLSVDPATSTPTMDDREP